MAITKKEKLKRFFPSLYKIGTNENLKAFIESIGESDDNVVNQIKNAKEQIFVNTAQGSYLDRLGSNVGVERPILETFSISDDEFRNIIKILSFYPKQVKDTMLDLLEAFFGNDNKVQIKEVNTNEIVVQLPRNLVSARDSILGTTHFKNYQGTIKSIDNTTKKIRINLESPYLEYFSQFPKHKQAITGSGVSSTTVGWNLSDNADSIIYSEAKDLKNISNISFELGKTLTSSVYGTIFKKFETPLNLKGLSFWAYRPPSETDINSIDISLSSSDTLYSASSAPNFTRFRKVLNSGWNFISIDLPNTDDVQDTNGVLDLEAVKQIIISFVADNATDTFSGVKITDLRITEINEQYSLNYFQDLQFLSNQNSFTIQNSTLGLLDMELEFNAGDDLSSLNVNDTFFIYDENYKGDYLFAPNESYTQYGEKAILKDAITVGDSGSIINVEDGANIPDEEGYVILNFGLDNQELVKYLEKPSENEILLDPAHTFSYSHAVDDNINLADNSGFEPNDNGQDHATYVVGTEEPVILVQNLLEDLKASGINIRFIIVD